jgi:hypothetical protein
MENLVVLLWACVYWLLRCIGKAATWTWREAFAYVEPYVGKVTFLKAVTALCLGATGIGVLGVLMAIMR